MIKKRMSDSVKDNGTKTLVALLLGELAYFLIASIPVLIISTEKLKAELGLLLGTVLAMAMILHMNSVIKKSFYMEGHQSAYMAWSAVGRLVVVAGLLVLMALTRWVNAITMLVGLFSLKASAYLQTYFEKKKAKTESEIPVDFSDEDEDEDEDEADG